MWMYTLAVTAHTTCRGGARGSDAIGGGATVEQDAGAIGAAKVAAAASTAICTAAAAAVTFTATTGGSVTA